MDLLLAFVIAMVVTMALIPLLARVAAHCTCSTIQKSRKVHSQPIPRVGGIAMVAGTVLPLWLWLPMDPDLSGYLLAVDRAAGVWDWDDRVNLGAVTKLFGQLHRRTHHHPRWPRFDRFPHAGRASCRCRIGLV